MTAPNRRTRSDDSHLHVVLLVGRRTDAPRLSRGAVESIQSRMNPDFWSPDLTTRYRAVAAGGDTVLTRRWPAGCGGAANAFLVLLGPSMGGARKGETPAVGGKDRPFVKPMKLGPEAMNFDWGDHRKVRWTRLCAEMLGSEAHARALTALLNLDWRHSANEKDISREALVEGLEGCIWPLLSVVRPRILCALTNRVWKTVLPKVEPLRVAFKPCPVILPREPIVFRLPGCDFPTFFIKPHNHPSRFLSNEQMAALGEATRWFLAQPLG